ncbi:hypothetical protein [Lactiplantibacillus plantarum]|uniref:hypothetical protein n=1 Tax=Lactiplantibacillus plantarum TaxID=1590 RepID=UPI001BA7EE80|nr:hypothetical protein [Lactiplantibacillus plantarum]MBS0935711.1 hypothetical protein [Lactiplantibacillus plantarum]MBS0943932.1 hypothetical protein [Lactiplantibacillus plantarum]MBS0955479.1 hypothetical protein [Lactiplantibacillus plantarum]
MTSEAQARASKKYDETNIEATRHRKGLSGARSFIKNRSTLNDLDSLRALIDERDTELVAAGATREVGSKYSNEILTLVDKYVREIEQCKGEVELNKLIGFKELDDGVKRTLGKAVKERAKLASGSIELAGKNTSNHLLYRARN